MNKPKKVNRKPASKNLLVIDRLNKAIADARVTVPVVATLLGIKDITTRKYLKKERNVKNDIVAKKMVVVTNILNEMIQAEVLPADVEYRNRSTIILRMIDEHVAKRSENN